MTDLNQTFEEMAREVAEKIHSGFYVSRNIYSGLNAVQIDTEALTQALRAAYSQGYRAGQEEMRAAIRNDTVEWLEVTGVIPKGTSYYYELLACVEEAALPLQHGDAT